MSDDARDRLHRVPILTIDTPGDDVDVALAVAGHAEGAEPNGSRMAKQSSKPGDAHDDGALCTVLSSFVAPDAGLAYFVVWDDVPGVPVLIAGHRLRKA